MNHLLEAALQYARRGWAVFPCHTPHLLNEPKTFTKNVEKGGETKTEEITTTVVCSCSDGAFCDSKGKHPRTMHGVNDATIDEATIRQWWSLWPEANIGLATGDRSGVDVLDVDGLDGEKTLDALQQKHGRLPPTLIQLTGGGGKHFVFRKSPVPLKNEVKFLPGLDVRTTGGLIIVDPSLHASSNEYKWQDSDVEPAPMPQWLVDLIPKRDEPKPQSQSTTAGGKIAKGSRNQMLFEIGCAMRRHGTIRETIETALLAENANRCDPPLSEVEVKSIASKAAKYNPSLTFDQAMTRIAEIQETEEIQEFLEASVEPVSWWRRAGFSAVIGILSERGIDVKWIADWKRRVSEKRDQHSGDPSKAKPQANDPPPQNGDEPPPNGNGEATQTDASQDSPATEAITFRTMEEVWQEIAPQKQTKDSVEEEATAQSGEAPPPDAEAATPSDQDAFPATDVEAVKTKLWDAVDDAAHWSKQDLGIFLDRLRAADTLTEKWLSDWQAAISEARQAERAKRKAKQAEKQADNKGNAQQDGGVSEGETCYMKRELMGFMFVTKPISSFLIKPKLRVWLDGKENLKADFVTPEKLYPDVVIRRRDWNTNDRFKDAFPSVDLTWTGDGNDVQAVQGIVAGEKVPVKQGTTQLGRQSNGSWVLPDGAAFDGQGRVTDPDLVYLPLGGTGEFDEKIGISDLDDAAYKRLMEGLFLNLFAVNLPTVTIPTIGWFMATPFKPLFGLRYEGFPILSIAGTRGAGKSTLLRLMWRLMGFRVGESGKLFSCTETDFVMLKLLSATTSIPIVFDEYKPYDMPIQRLRALTRLLRRAYDGEKEFRGRPDQSTVEYSLSAPIAIAGEVALTEGAMLERIISVEMSPNDLTAQMRKAYQTLRGLPLQAFMGRFIPFALRTDFDKELTQAEVLAADLLDLEALPDRIRKNLTVMIFGFNQFIRFGIEQGILDESEDWTPLLKEALCTVRDAVCGSDGVTKVALDYFIEHLAVMAETERLKHGRDYVIRETYQDIAIRFDACFAEYRKFHRETQLDGELLNAPAYRRQMRENQQRGGYIVDTSTSVKYEGINKRSVIIDPARADNMDWSGFFGAGEDKDDFHKRGNGW